MKEELNRCIGMTMDQDEPKKPESALDSLITRLEHQNSKVTAARMRAQGVIARLRGAEDGECSADPEPQRAELLHRLDYAVNDLCREADMLHEALYKLDDLV